MKNFLKLTSVILLLFISLYVIAQKKQVSYSVIDSTYTVMAKRKFDIEYFEKNKINFSLNYTKEDGTEIEQHFCMDIYLEHEWIPKKLYRIYREYYLNGNLKKEGLELGQMSIGIWLEFDEDGNEIRVRNMDDSLPKGFDYNKVMLLMEKEGRINTRTGEDRDILRMSYNKDKNQWEVSFLPIKRKDYLGIEYLIDAKSGKIKDKYDMKYIGG